MKRTIFALLLIFAVFNINAQERIRNDVVIYGNLEVKSNSNYTSIDSSFIPYLVVDSIALKDIKVSGSALNIKTDSLGLNGNYISEFFIYRTRNSTVSITGNTSFQTIMFSDIGTLNYSLIIEAKNNLGDIVFPTISNLTTSSFDIQIDINCTINYHIILN